MDPSLSYIDAKARIVRAINKVAKFVTTTSEYEKERTNVKKKAEVRQKLSELKELRRSVEEDIQVMESAVGQKTAPVEVVDNSCSGSLIDSFDSLYYELAAFGDVHGFALSSNSNITTSHSMVSYQSGTQNNSSIYQLPKRKFPTFSGNLTEWQGFEDLFKSILSHVPDLPEVECFEYLKTSLEGEALALISHLPLTAINYKTAWDLLKSRYGNKRDLSRIHLEAILAPYVIKSNNAMSIKNFVNNISEHTAALDNLEFVTRQWSPLLVHIFEKHLDVDLRGKWELTVGEKHNPQVNDFLNFLRSHVRAADARAGNQVVIEYSAGRVKPSQRSRPSPNVQYHATSLSKVLAATTVEVQQTNCPLCKKQHAIHKCQIFVDQSANERYQTAKTQRLCINCLRTGHSSAGCPSKYTCQSCHKRHHSTLHFPAKQAQSDTMTASVLVASINPRAVLLATLLVNVTSITNENYTIRALLDTGAQASFITQDCADRLLLHRRRCATQVQTFSGAPVNVVSGITTLAINPVGRKNPSIPLEVYIVKNITDLTPQSPILCTSWPHIKDLVLADPTFSTPGPVDILLGAEVAASILTGDRIVGQSGHPTAFSTPFGWILMGSATPFVQESVTSLCVNINTSLETAITQFWEQEEPPQKQHLSPEDLRAEEIFTSSIKRLKSGHFSVALPFKQNRPILGESKGLALKRFYYLEHRLSRDSDLRQQYSEFMKDYLESKHMEVIPLLQRNTPYCYYIPHHCILRPDSQTTKLRVVFDASAKTTTGQSLNNHLYTGQKLQRDLPQILMRARLHKFLFTADIKQMYRQIEIHQEDRDYLRILWRFDSQTPVEEYRLNTVTYGTACAPHQALRTLQFLAATKGTVFPLAAKILMRDTFMDDILTGANSEEDALSCQHQLISLCAEGQFQLRKWASNAPFLLNSVPEEDRSMSPSVWFDDDLNTGLKILGMRWNPKQDEFAYTFKQFSVATTKRSILSDLARIFDPLGFLTPLTFLAKYLIQLLWTSGVGWDDPVSEQVQKMWQRVQREIPCLHSLNIPRRLTRDGSVKYELHTFSDSSERGYAAAVYLRCESESVVHCYLITAKSKVAPLKRMTIPRLELCGALLAAKLLNHVHEVVSPLAVIHNMYGWTDSLTALSWIQSSPHRWSTFIANRTSQLQSLTSPSIWRYVPTAENPVDCASRGLYPEELLQHPLWWNGPAFLCQDPTTWPPTHSNKIESDLTNSEERRTTLVLTINTQQVEQLLQNFSSLPTIIRIVAYCSRFFAKSKPSTLNLSPLEQINAMQIIIRIVQSYSFGNEFAQIRERVHTGASRLRNLSPFFDEHGLIRVGGRLNQAEIPYQQKHPILLPRSHRFTDLLIDDYHKKHKHPGATTLQSIIAQQYWIIASRQAIKSRLKECLSCYKTRPRSTQPFMGDIPKVRLQQVKAFMNTGVDYAGPIFLKPLSTRKTVHTQVYICLFVCMSTKALHLELASDLSTETFLMAFSRFISRRGPVEKMFSDCGTNFVGTSNLFKSVDKFTNSKEYQDQCQTYLTNRNIIWQFNPPSAPHFGGLWEAGVKSVKNLLYRTLGLQRLHYEELSTLLCHIEATLNSRPLGALTTDPADFEALTSSHFLTLMPSTAPVEPNLNSIPMSHLQRWRLVKDLHTHFWKRWQSEYLQTLQRRTKWATHTDNLKGNTLVLIREPTAPLLWKLGRIVQLHPGQDGIARVATIQTPTGIIKRPIVKLCPLPIY